MMKSPITGKEMSLHKEVRTLTFRKEQFTVLYHYFHCGESGEQFTSTELDEINIHQLYNQYREKYHIPFPDEIKAIREKYSLSAVKMAEALGFGVNMYRNYESGEVPNESNGKLIRLAQETESFQQIVKLSGTLDQKSKEKILKTIDDLLIAEHHSVYTVDLHEYFFGSRIPDEFSGYKRPSLEKFAEMVIYFAEKVQPWKTKLNKLLFYADFVYFRQTCFSMSGVRYRAIDMGPVPNNFNTIFDYLAERDDVDIYRTEFPNGSLGEQFKPNPKRSFKPELFSEGELQALDMIVQKFAPASTQDIIDISHKEKGWKENFERGKQLISYKYGFELETI
jgi:putative zinc finger/helix-turn-helix YgiT family protein